MKTSGLDSLDPAVVARREAAAWVARMHAPDRSARVDAACRRWLAASALNREAFELANEVWDGVGQLPLTAAPRRRIVWSLAASVLFAAIALSALGITLFRDRVGTPQLSTVVGEQRTLTLEDGTRVTLNTATRVVVDFDARRRHVRLDAGEALFEVAARPDRPFVVTAGNRQITALGTSFLVRRDSQQVVVTLVDGRVRVGAAADAPSRTQLLAPGERVTYSGSAAPERDRPSLERLMSWRQGRVTMDHTTLQDAVAELNRYSALPLVVADPQARAVRISGVFRVGDPLLFAQAIAATYGLRVVQETDRIVLEGMPAPR